ncbi:MAG: thermonuclease family protein [Leptolyngbya sp. SIO4C1]|nr:thermonuclease family protein [Leptolyngbya sp. SIO4C1]
MPRLRFHLNFVKDGDTIIASQLAANARTETIRFYGIDCPELAQHPYGEQARQRIEQLLAPYDTLEIIEVDRDRHGRLVGEVWVTDGCLNTQLLSEGLAVAYRKHLHGDYQRRYLEAENIARRARLNFWRQRDPEMPWEYRYRHPRR